MEDVLQLLDYVRDELLSMDNGIPRARVLVQLCGEFIHSLELSEIESRLAALEAANVKK